VNIIQPEVGLVNEEFMDELMASTGGVVAAAAYLDQITQTIRQFVFVAIISWIAAITTMAPFSICSKTLSSERKHSLPN
jgi:uncharacterized membrane protein (DUF4010 family)